MKRNTACFAKFLEDESGVEVVEYSIIVGLIVGVSLAAITAIGIWVTNTFTAFEDEVTP